MIVNILRSRINKKKENAVTSELIFQPHMRQTATKIKTHSDGIFSKRIFGNIGSCDCGSLDNEGFCEKCETRVINHNNLPDFYIDLTTVVPASFPDYESTKDPDTTESIINYESFYYNGEIFKISEDFDDSKFDQSKVLIGIEALSAIGVDDNWIKENTLDFLSIPHTIFRPIVIDGRGKPLITNINKMYSDIIGKINNAIDMHEYTKNRPFHLMAEYRAISSICKSITAQLFSEIQDTRYSVVKSEIISHPISGAIRGVLINRFDVDEDVIIIGDTFIETLFPYLYKKHNGFMPDINKEIIDKGLTVLINRPPTISHMSVMAMKPRIASVYPFNNTSDSNNCLEHNHGYVNDNIHRFNNKEADGDIEKFGSDEIDTIGLRCVGVNPIIFDGMSADTDGDVILVVSLYTKDSIKESHNMLPSKSYIDYSNGSIRNSIIEDFIFTEKDDSEIGFKKGLDRYKHLDRGSYNEVNNSLSQRLWDNQDLPTVYDISDFVNGNKNKRMDRIFNFFENEEDFSRLAENQSNSYTQKESSSFIKKVMSANNEEISKAGYFYKLLMASADDYYISKDDCRSDGYSADISRIDENYYNYKIKMMHVVEYGDFVHDEYCDFIDWCKNNNLDNISIRSPLECSGSFERKLCSVCSGSLPPNTFNIGTFTTLMVTEHATQSALSSMNKSEKNNINDIIASRYNGNQNIEDIKNWIKVTVDKLADSSISSRFYEIALLSRVRFDENKNPFISSLKSSISNSDNLFGSYIFTPNNKTFEKMVKKREFIDNSIKLQIAVNKMKKR